MFAWLTKNNIPSGRIEYVLSLPDDETWRADFLGALFLLTQPQNWELDQGLTPQEMADEWEKVFYDFNEGVYTLIPVGTILAFGGSVAPSGFFMCDFSEFDRTQFANLFAVIGTAYGVGNGTTTANLPNLKGRILVGRDSSQAEFDVLGESGGSKTHTLTSPELASHNHTQDTHNHTQNTHNHTQDTHNHTQNTHNHTQDLHGHTVSPHNHTVDGALNLTLGSTGRSLIAQGSGSNNVLSRDANVGLATAVATNQPTVATNQTTVATNQPTVATNQPTVATNQASGGGGAHNNLQPYVVINYIIKY